ncbi:MAG: hypothetical protein JXJ22_13010 [Bacteroidales bacterium]|nr:hypothetical protein [Bacteroidales bacterium]
MFGSIVILCSVYALFLAFYVNDKVQIINEKNKKSIFRKDKYDQELINKKFDELRVDLTKKSKKIMFYILTFDLIVNTLIIIFTDDITLREVLFGTLFPIFCYLVFVLFLLIAIGLKGQRVLHTGKFFKGLDY